MNTKKRFLLSPYNFSLFIFLSLFYIIVFIFVAVYCDFPRSYDAGLICVLGCTMLSAIILAALLRESTGVITIENERIVLRSFLRKTIIFPFESISHIGIDFGVVNFHRQYYIYLSKAPLTRKYQHNLNQLKITESIIKIAYRDEVFETLISTLPQNLSKTLRASYSIFRANNDTQ